MRKLKTNTSIREITHAEICTSREDAKKFLEDCLRAIDEG